MVDRLSAHSCFEHSRRQELVEFPILLLRENLQLLQVGDRLDRFVAVALGFADLLGEMPLDLVTTLSGRRKELVSLRTGQSLAAGDFGLGALLDPGRLVFERFAQCRQAGLVDRLALVARSLVPRKVISSGADSLGECQQARFRRS